MTQSTKAWVLTGGINKGLTKYIGEALRGTTVCMGITPWNKVANRLNLLGVNERKRYILPETFNTKDQYLDNNHTHFFLVDSNYAENHNQMIDFDTSLVTVLKKIQYEGTKLSLYVSKYFLRSLLQGCFLLIYSRCF